MFYIPIVVWQIGLSPLGHWSKWLMANCHLMDWLFVNSFVKMTLGQLSWDILTFGQWGSVTQQMALPVPSISCCVLNHHNLFNQIENALAFYRETCCHLVLCYWLLPFHCHRFIFRIIFLLFPRFPFWPFLLITTFEKKSFSIFFFVIFLQIHFL